MHDEERLKEKLRAIEALFAGATTEGEREAAGHARQRVAARLAELKAERPIEWQFSLDPWSRKLLMALARRYGLTPYRYRRQRYSTLIIQASERFLKETFLPEYGAMAETLRQHLTEVAERVVEGELPEGGQRTAEENKKARNFFKNNKEADERHMRRERARLGARMKRATPSGPSMSGHLRMAEPRCTSSPATAIPTLRTPPSLVPMGSPTNSGGGD